MLKLKVMLKNQTFEAIKFKLVEIKTLVTSSEYKNVLYKIPLITQHIKSYKTYVL